MKLERLTAHGDRRLAPLSAFFLAHPDFPTHVPAHVPWDERGLHRLAGYGSLNDAERDGTPMVSRRSKKRNKNTGFSYLVPGIYRWKEIALRWPALRDWLVSEAAFASPPDWPWPEVAPAIGEHITPLIWHLTCVERRGQPRSAEVPYRAKKAELRGILAMSAWAAGWPLEPAHHRADVIAATEWLSTRLPWTVFAYNPRIDLLPVYTGVFKDPLRSLGRRNEIQRLPLSTTRRDYMSLPPEFRDVRALRSLPRRPFDLARSQRPDYTPWVPEGVTERDMSRWSLRFRGSWI